MSFWKKISPTGAARDFWQVWTGNPHRWATLGAAMLVSAGLLSILIPQSVRIPPAKPTVTYITTHAAGRTDAEIRAANVESQKQQDALAAELARREEARKDLYRQLGRMSGIDVDAMERKIEQEKAAEAAAEAAAKQARDAGRKLADQ